MKGILLVDKPEGMSSFKLIPRLRRLANEPRIGHAGTLDPFATGLMVYLIGREFTRKSADFLNHDKVYQAQFRLGIETDSYDLTGRIVSESSNIPTIDQLDEAIAAFQGYLMQVPPMFSAKKSQGRRLYDLARQGQVLERPACPVHVTMTLISYHYPHVEVHIHCFKGTYVRSLAYDLGQKLGCGAHVTSLRRIASGPFHIDKAIHPDFLIDSQTLQNHLIFPQEDGNYGSISTNI